MTNPFRVAGFMFYLFNKKNLKKIDDYFLKKANSYETAVPINERLFKKLKVEEVFTIDELRQYLKSHTYYNVKDKERFYINEKRKSEYERGKKINTYIVLLSIALLAFFFYAFSSS